MGRVRKTTLSDVAEKAGVSRTTVSYILGKTRGGFAKETVERVQQAAKELGFKPSPIARSLRTGRSRLIGLVVESDGLSARCYNRCQIEAGIAAESVKHQQDVLQVIVSSDADSEIRRVSDLLGTGLVEGLILTAHSHRPVIDWLRDYGARFVVIGNPNVPNVASVDIDNVGLGAAMAQHLIDLGHTNLLYIAPPDDVAHGNDRAEGFLLACAEAGIPAERSNVLRAEHSRAGGYAAMREAITSGLDATGVCATDDAMAYGAIAAIREAGLNVPTNISVVGCNNDRSVGIDRHFLTTFELDFTKLGTLAAAKLIAMLEERPTSRRELVGFRLIPGKSSGPAP